MKDCNQRVIVASGHWELVMTELIMTIQIFNTFYHNTPDSENVQIHINLDKYGKQIQIQCGVDINDMNSGENQDCKCMFSVLPGAATWLMSPFHCYQIYCGILLLTSTFVTKRFLQSKEKILLFKFSFKRLVCICTINGPISTSISFHSLN